jgi:hypothetical protein
MTGMPTIYCVQCRALRPVSDWRERRDTLIIRLEPCGHLVVRNACLEWT